MTNDYDKMLALGAEAAAAQRKAADAERPWKELAYKIAMETRGIYGSGYVRFEKDRFRISCQGTGIHSDEEWWESFPAELLISRMRQSGEGTSNGQ